MWVKKNNLRNENIQLTIQDAIDILRTITIEDHAQKDCGGADGCGTARLVEQVRARGYTVEEKAHESNSNI